MLPYKLIYHPGYDLNLGGHVFPSRKYRMIHDRLIADGFASPEDFEEPAAATDEQLPLSVSNECTMFCAVATIVENQGYEGTSSTKRTG